MSIITSSQEERYAAILQPIRDMARNWDVDIAHYLEEYLEDLEKIEITFDDGVTTMNFSEAALLIQGSANIYAKKVEYLHSLVYQALDLVTQKKKQKGQDGENEDNENTECNADYEFLPLDDIPDSDGAQSYLKELDMSNNKSVQPHPQMLNSLMPLEDGEKGDNPTYNKKGEVIGDYCDFVMNTGLMAEDGSHLLEYEDEPLISAITRQIQPMNIIAEEMEMMSYREESHAAPLDDNEAGEDFPGAPGLGDGGEQLQGKATEARELRARKKRVSFAPSVHKPVKDPWELLDPFEKSKAVEKPIKKKIPFKIPPGLPDTSTKKRKKKVVDLKKELPPLNEVVELLYSNRPSFPKNPLKIPEFPELDGAFWQEFKLREKWKKEEIKQLKQEERQEEETILEEVNGENQNELARDDDVDDDFEQLPGLQMEPDLFGNDQGNLRRMTMPELGVSHSSFTDELSMTYEDLVRKHVEQFLASAGEYAQITELSRRVSEWEEKVKPKLDEENSHEPFDIHKYGTFILDQLVRGEKRLFKDLIKGKPEFEICRYALATLLLANVYNVELSLVPDQSGSTMDRLYVTLLSKKRHFEELEEYRAPSVKDS